MRLNNILLWIACIKHFPLSLYALHLHGWAQQMAKLECLVIHPLQNGQPAPQLFCSGRVQGVSSSHHCCGFNWCISQSNNDDTSVFALTIQLESGMKPEFLAGKTSSLGMLDFPSSQTLQNNFPKFALRLARTPGLFGYRLKTLHCNFRLLLIHHIAYIMFCRKPVKK